MATRPAQKPPNRPNGASVGGSSSSGMDVGLSAVAQMARDDTRWFVVGVVVLSVALFLGLPAGILLMVDQEKRLGAIERRVDRKIHRLEKLEKELQEQKDK
jgi:ABC-type Na+ efflux pump permease subunit